MVLAIGEKYETMSMYERKEKKKKKKLFTIIQTNEKHFLFYLKLIEQVYEKIQIKQKGLECFA